VHLRVLRWTPAGAILARRPTTLKDAARRCAVACGHP
jgi:hypothetical protein